MVYPLNRELLWREKISSSSYHSRTPKYYLQQLDPRIFNSFNSEQLQAITSILNQAIPKPSPKIVDLRFVVDLIFSRFYIVLFVGKDRRKRKRQYFQGKISKAGNLIAAAILLIGLNFLLSAFILLFAYLIKSAVGINFFPGHITETIQKYM